MAALLDRLRSVDSPDGGVVLNIENGKMFRLNPIGMRILARLNQGTPAADIVDEISRDYSVDPQIAREDFKTFLAALQACGLVDPVAGTSEPQREG
jgi:PqqD family protein of HPr-rel-A system